MAKTLRLKSSRKAETRKVDLAIKYARRGSATGGGRIGAKKLRRNIEARSVPMFQRPGAPRKKMKTGRRHVPPLTAPRE